MLNYDLNFSKIHSMLCMGGEKMCDNIKCPDDHIGLLIKYIANSIKNEINNNLAKFDVTAVQESVLLFLWENPNRDIFQKDIEEHLKLKNPTVTGIVKRLEEKGMISRTHKKDDARCKCHFLTDKGKHVVEDTIGYGVNYIEKKLTKDLSFEEKENLIYLLKKVLKSMEE